MVMNVYVGETPIGEASRAAMNAPLAELCRPVY